MVAIDPPTSAVVIFGDENDEIVKLLNTSASQFLSLGDNIFIFFSKTTHFRNQILLRFCSNCQVQRFNRSCFKNYRFTDKWCYFQQFFSTSSRDLRKLRALQRIRCATVLHKSRADKRDASVGDRQPSRDRRHRRRTRACSSSSRKLYLAWGEHEIG